MELWRRPSPAHTAGHSNVRCLQRRMLQEAVDHVPHISDQFNTYADGEKLCHLAQQGHIPADCSQVPNH